MSALGMAMAVVAWAAFLSSPGLAAAGTPPANDVFANATAVITLPFSQTALDTTSATVESNEPRNNDCAFGEFYNWVPANTVWYRYDALNDGPIEVNTFGSNFDTAIAVFSGPDINHLTPVGCDNPSGTFPEFMAFDAVTGTTYWIQVGGAAGDPQRSGLLDVTMKVHQPRNDFFANATKVTTLPFSQTALDTTYATPARPAKSGDPSPGACRLGTFVQYYAANTVWYRYDAPSDGLIEADTFGSNFDTAIAVWSGPDITDLTLVGCVFSPGTLGEAVPFDAVTGTTYWIQMGGACCGPSSGLLDVKISGAPAPTPSESASPSATPTPSRSALPSEFASVSPTSSATAPRRTLTVTPPATTTGGPTSGSGDSILLLALALMGLATTGIFVLVPNPVNHRRR